MGPRRVTAIARVSLAICLAGSVMSCARPPASTRPNILLVTIDTWRADRLSAAAAPRLDELARQIAPIYFFRSALPVNVVDGRDLNLDGDAVDIPANATGLGSYDPSTNTWTTTSLGACTTVNCGRGASQQSLNLRLQKSFTLKGRARIDAIGEIFNVFNAVNPSGFRARANVPSTGAADPALLQPTTFSGDFRRPEQRLGQIGFRFTF